MKQPLILLVMFFATTAAFGQPRQLMTAKELQTACATGMKVFEAQGEASTEDAAEYGKCLGYFEGVLDSMRLLVEADEHGKIYKFHLHGDGLAVKDAIKFFLAFMKEDKEYDHNGPATPMVIRSLTTNHVLTRLISIF